MANRTLTLDEQRQVPDTVQPRAETEAAAVEIAPDASRERGSR